MNEERYIDLIHKEYGLPKRMILMMFYAKATYCLAVKHFSFRFERDKKTKKNPLAFYGLGFAPSGSGKDKSSKMLDDIFFNKFFDYIEDEYKKRHVERMKEIEDFAEKNFVGGSKAIYISNNTPHEVDIETHNYTEAAFRYKRAAMYQFKFGAMFYVESELGLTLKKDDSVLDALSRYYDGESYNTARAGEKKSIKSKGIPTIFLGWTSAARLRNTQAYQIIIDALEVFMARRCFVCFPEENEFSLPKISDQSLEGFETSDPFYLNFLGLFRSLKQEHCIVFPNKLRSLILRYCNRKRIQARNLHDEILKVEMMNRDIKIYRLAVLFNVLYFNNIDTVQIESVRMAVKYLESFKEDLNRLLNYTVQDEYDSLFNFFLENKNIPIDKTTFRKKAVAFRVVKKDSFKNDQEKILDSLNILAETKGLHIKYRQEGRRETYTLINLMEDFK